MQFEPKKEFSSVVEKRNAIGLWVKRFVVFRDLIVMLCDSEKEKSTPTTKFVVNSVAKVAEDPLAVNFQGRTDSLVVRFSDNKAAESWYDLVSSALTLVKQARASLQRSPSNLTSNGGPSGTANSSPPTKVVREAAELPSIDPRFGLPFVDVPSEHAAKFANLERSVLYWFSPVTKFGAPSAFSKKLSTESRIAFCGDKAFYLTKPNSEITRCIKINKITRLVTNAASASSAIDPVASSQEPPFIVIQMTAPDYDLCFSAPKVDALVHCLESIYVAQSAGTPLRVDRIASLASMTDMRLERPKNFTMTMVVPSTKDQLLKALDQYAKKNGVRFSENGVEARRSDTSSVNNASFTSASAAPAGSQDSQALTDPLFCFLKAIGCPKHFYTLYRQNVDLDIVECMDETDLRTYGISDTNDIQKILANINDTAVRDRVKAEVEAARSGWVDRQAVKSVPSAPAATKTAAPAAPSSARVVIELDSDDDDIVVPARPAKSETGADEGSGSAAVSKFQISLDSDDDDDDLDVLPAKAPPAAAKPPIILDDDDI